MIRFLFVFTFVLLVSNANSEPRQSTQKIVFQTNFGDIQKIAPETVAHIFKLVQLGCYNTNHFFRVDKGFVAQVQDCRRNPLFPLNEEQLAEANKQVKLEVVRGVVHVEGALSMGRLDDPDSNGSSFSILLGAAPHLDMKYTIFGKVIKGMETLRKMEQVKTYKKGVFVMPKERITIHSTYTRPINSEIEGGCFTEWARLQSEYDQLATNLEVARAKCFPA
eukprot:g811.t1